MQPSVNTELLAMAHVQSPPSVWFSIRFRKLICDNVNSKAPARYHVALAINDAGNELSIKRISFGVLLVEL